jgi:hypothetical protein
MYHVAERRLPTAEAALEARRAVAQARPEAIRERASGQPGRGPFRCTWSWPGGKPIPRGSERPAESAMATGCCHFIGPRTDPP